MPRIIVSLIAFITSSYVLACSCHLGSVEDKLKNAESVFLGKVLSVVVLDEKNAFGENRIIVKLDIKQSFKNTETSITLDTFDNGVSCEGYWFKEGQEYLIYAYKMEKRLSTLYCGGVLPKDTQKGSIFMKELNHLKLLQGNTHNNSSKKDAVNRASS